MLELEDGFIKSACVNKSSPLTFSAIKILNESSNIIKNVSMNKLNGMDSDDLNNFVLGNNNLSEGSGSNFFIDERDIIEVVKKSNLSSDTESSNYSKSNYSKSNTSVSNISRTKSDEDSRDNSRIFGAGLFNQFSKLNKRSKIIDIE